MFFKKMRLEIEELWDIVRIQQEALDSLAERITYGYIEPPLVYPIRRGKNIYINETLRLLMDKLKLDIEYAPKKETSEFILTEKEVNKSV